MLVRKSRARRAAGAVGGRVSRARKGLGALGALKAGGAKPDKLHAAGPPPKKSAAASFLTPSAGRRKKAPGLVFGRPGVGRGRGVPGCYWRLLGFVCLMGPAWGVLALAWAWACLGLH